MKNYYNQVMSKKKFEKLIAIVFFILSIVLLQSKLVHAQISWSGYTTSALSTTPYTYSTGIMTAKITKTNTTMSDGSGAATPKYYAANPGAPCYTAGSLALYTAFFNSYIANSSNVVLDMQFTTAQTTNGTCNSVSFTINDINSGESFLDFLDVIEITAIAGNGAAIPATSIVATVPGNTNSSIVATNTRKIVGHNSVNETQGSYSSSACNNTSITVTPPAGVPLRSIKIIYRPGVGTSSSDAYWTSGTHPAAQYVSISNLTLAATGGGCSVGLPIELIEFNGKCNSGTKTFKWNTASETNNSFFTIEHSVDAEKWIPVKTIKGAGTITTRKSYSVSIEEDNIDYRYYRLKQTDFDGKFEYFETVIVDCNEGLNTAFRIFPNPNEGFFEIMYLNNEPEGEYKAVIINLLGEIVLEQSISNENSKIDISNVKKGMYQIAIFRNGNLEYREKISKQ